MVIAWTAEEIHYVWNSKNMKAWENVGERVMDIVTEFKDELVNIGIKPTIYVSHSCEGGFEIGNYPYHGFDLRSYNYNDDGKIHWRIKPYIPWYDKCNKKRIFKRMFKQIAKESQEIWDKMCGNEDDCKFIQPYILGRIWYFKTRGCSEEKYIDIYCRWEGHKMEKDNATNRNK